MKNRIINLRYKARNRGFKLSKSKMCLSQYNLGQFMLMKLHTNEILFGENYSASLEEIEKFLEQHDQKCLTQKDF